MIDLLRTIRRVLLLEYRLLDKEMELIDASFQFVSQWNPSSKREVCLPLTASVSSFHSAQASPDTAAKRSTPPSL